MTNVQIGFSIGAAVFFIWLLWKVNFFGAIFEVLGLLLDALFD
jgi:hypothetical protein